MNISQLKQLVRKLPATPTLSTPQPITHQELHKIDQASRAMSRAIGQLGTGNTAHSQTDLEQAMKCIDKNQQVLIQQIQKTLGLPQLSTQKRA